MLNTSEKLKYIREHYSVKERQCCIVECYKITTQPGKIIPFAIGIIPRSAVVKPSAYSGFSTTDKLFIVESYSGFVRDTLLERENAPLMLLVKPVV